MACDKSNDVIFVWSKASSPIVVKLVACEKSSELMLVREKH